MANCLIGAMPLLSGAMIIICQSKSYEPIQANQMSTIIFGWELYGHINKMLAILCSFNG